jgi:hypothetical protein
MVAGSLKDDASPFAQSSIHRQHCNLTSEEE